jgi:hypothetical protein
MASILSAGTTSATAMVHTADTSGVLQLASNNGTVAVTIDTSSRFGINQTSPAYLLDVNGTMRLGSGGTVQPLLLRSTVTGGLVVNTTASGGAGPLVVQDSGTEVFRVTDSLVVLKGGNTAATGTGITFPATQSASSDANTLDDYEEGTWTTTFNTPINLTGTPTLSQAIYTKIGRLVTVVGKISGYSITSSNTATYPVINLPFPMAANDTAITGSVFAVVGAVYISGVAVDNTGGDNTSLALIMPAVSVTTTGTVSIVFTVVYQTTT